MNQQKNFFLDTNLRMVKWSKQIGTKNNVRQSFMHECANMNLFKQPKNLYYIHRAVSIFCLAF